MRTRLVLPLLLALLAATGCAPTPPPPPPPAPPPPPTTEVVVRRVPWLARNFDELSPQQRSQIEQRMARTREATSREEARIRWDTLGLEERRTLLFPRDGRSRARPLPLPPAPPPPPEQDAPAG